LTHDVELWFDREDYKLYLLAHGSSLWWKNIAKNPTIEVEGSEILFEGTGRIVQDKLDHLFELFRRKYGPEQVERWYGASRSKRRAVEIELGRVLGKRPSSRNQRQEIAI